MVVELPEPGNRDVPRRPGSAATASETIRGSRPAARRSGSERLAIAAGGVLSALVLLAACTIGYFNWRLGQINRIDLGLPEAPPGGPENYLIVGSDSRAGIDAESANAGGFLNDPEYQSNPDGSGRRSDTIMVMRIDPSTKAVTLLSFPRDLYVPIAGKDRSDKINAAFGIGVSTLVDTIQENFDIPINHYVEIDFVGFEKLVDAMGGVDLYFDRQMWDSHTGLNITTTGCHSLNGADALAFARSRYLWYNTLGEETVDTSSLRYLNDAQMKANGWSSDGTSDLGRISRQQLLIRSAIPQAEHAAFKNPATLNAIMASIVSNVTVDSALTSKRLISLANRFRHFDPDAMVTYSYPGTPAVSDRVGSILEPDTKAAEPILAKFRDETAASKAAQIPVRVLNGSGIDHQAGNVAGALERVGFQIEGTGDASTVGIDTLTTTQVRYAPASVITAIYVAQHLSAPVELVPLDSATSDVIEVITGTSFTTVSTQTRELSSTEKPPAAKPSEGTTTGETDPASSASSTTTSSTVVGVIPDQTDRSC